MRMKSNGIWAAQIWKPPRLPNRLGTAGYEIRCLYILTKDPAIHIQRVAQRVRKGHHDVPADKIVARYWRAMKKIPQLLALCVCCLIFDNSLERESGSPACIASVTNRKLQLFPNQVWSAEMLHHLINGTYDSVMSPDEAK